MTKVIRVYQNSKLARLINLANVLQVRRYGKEIFFDNLKLECKDEEISYEHFCRIMDFIIDDNANNLILCNNF